MQSDGVHVWEQDLNYEILQAMLDVMGPDCPVVLGGVTKDGEIMSVRMPLRAILHHYEVVLDSMRRHLERCLASG